MGGFGPRMAAIAGRHADGFNTQAAHPQLAELARVGDRVLLPDFEGMSVAQVREITARHGLAVEISGNGRAIAQEPPPGTVVGVHGARIRVRFGAGANET